MHWQFTPTVEAFLQREGRLDRPKSLTMRHKVWKWAACLDPSGSYSSYSDAWKKIKTECENESPEIFEHSQDNENARGKGLVPLWVLELPDALGEEEKKKYRIEQIIAVNEYNESLNDFAQGLKAAYDYGEGLKE